MHYSGPGLCVLTVISYITFILKENVCMSYECFELCEVLRSYSSGLNDPTPLL